MWISGDERIVMIYITAHTTSDYEGLFTVWQQTPGYA